MSSKKGNQYIWAMDSLNFPNYSFQIKTRENKTLIFDIIRKKYVVLTPEEWVRQHCVWFLIYEKNYPKSLINLEKQFTLNHRRKRTDIVCYSSSGNPLLIVECKAPSIQISQETFDQIAKYNLQLNSKYLLVTNGVHHYCCQMDHVRKRFNFLKEVPAFEF